MAETQPAQSIVTSAANQSSPYTHSLHPHCFLPELLEKTLPQLLAPEFADLFPDYVETIRRDGMASGRMMLMTRGGERRVWEYHNWLRIDAQTRPFVVGMAHDVTE